MSSDILAIYLSIVRNPFLDFLFRIRTKRLVTILIQTSSITTTQVGILRLFSSFLPHLNSGLSAARPHAHMIVYVLHHEQASCPGHVWLFQGLTHACIIACIRECLRIASVFSPTPASSALFGYHASTRKLGVAAPMSQEQELPRPTLFDITLFLFPSHRSLRKPQCSRKPSRMANQVRGRLVQDDILVPARSTFGDRQGLLIRLPIIPVLIYVGKHSENKIKNQTRTESQMSSFLHF